MNTLLEVMRIVVDLLQSFHGMRIVSPEHGDDEFQSRIMHCDKTGKTYIVHVREIKSACKIPDKSIKKTAQTVNRISAFGL